jgi:hypothetical protein
MTEPNPIPVATVLDTMRSLATRVITEHLHRDGACAACGQRWPCGPVILADHNLAVATTDAPR